MPKPWSSNELVTEVTADIRGSIDKWGEIKTDKVSERKVKHLRVSRGM